MTDRPDIDAQTMCRELRQEGYFVPYTVMTKVMQASASAEILRLRAALSDAEKDLEVARNFAAQMRVKIKTAENKIEGLEYDLGLARVAKTMVTDDCFAAQKESRTTKAQLATARADALREAAETRPNEYSVYGSDRTDAYARGFCGGVESYRRTIFDLIGKETS